MWLATLILIYCVLTVLASLVGGWLPSLIQLTHVRMQMIMSLVSGLMLGVALLHMMPHSAAYLPDHMSWVAGSMLAGLLVMFFLLRIFHVHQHGEHQHDDRENLNREPGHDEDHGHDEVHDHSPHHPGHGHDHSPEGPRKHRYSWVGIFFGLSIHSLLDGVALAASAVADSGHEGNLPLYGFGTFLAVLLHKPLDALSITSLMRTAGWSMKSQTLTNIGFALTCPLGALLLWLGTAQMTQGQSGLMGCALAFSAGFFLCIALSDLLPEVRFHTHDRVKLSVSLLLGVAVAMGIELLPSHSHEVHHGPQQDHYSHEHQTDDQHQH